MQKVNKDFSNPPASLNSEKTNRLRVEIIQHKRYPTGVKEYNESYKQEDIKEALLEIYNKKCAYCEQSVADHFFPIEHYRPRSQYYWLAYSWDNLFLCCDKCNTYKGDAFEIEAGNRTEFDEKDLNDIHNLTRKYNEMEKPLMVNPEMEDIEDKLIFYIETGKIESVDCRCQYTINCCRLDRKEANDNRKKIWDEFYEDLIPVIYRLNLSKNSRKDENNDGALKRKHHDAKVEFRLLIWKFKKDAHDPRKDYLTFRRYIEREYIDQVANLLRLTIREESK